MPDEHTPVSRKLRAHPCAAVVASKSIFSIEFVELSSTFVLASTIFGLALDASRNFMQKSLEFIELSHPEKWARVAARCFSKFHAKIHGIRRTVALFRAFLGFREKSLKSADLSHNLIRDAGIRVTVALSKVRTGCGSMLLDILCKNH